MTSAEITLRAWVDSLWFRTVARGCMILATALGGYAGFVLSTVNAKVDAQAKDTIEVQAILAVRTRDNEEFQADVNKDLDTLRAGQVAVQRDVSQVKLDIATMKGILMRQDNEIVLGER